MVKLLCLSESRSGVSINSGTEKTAINPNKRAGVTMSGMSGPAIKAAQTVRPAATFHGARVSPKQSA